MVEGQTCPGDVENASDDIVQTSHHVDRRDAQRGDPHAGEEAIPRRVPPGPVAMAVRFAIHFDREPGIVAEEVER